MISDDRAVVAGIRYEQGGPIGAQVARLRGDLALDCLDVAEIGLSLDKDIAVVDGQHCVTAPQIARKRHGHLCLPSCTRRQSASEALEEGQMRSIANRITIWVQRRSQLEPNDRADPRNQIDRHRRRVS
jgi:hypothetical protein